MCRLWLVSLLLLAPFIASSQPAELRFDEMYEGSGILGLQYSSRLMALNGQEVVVRGFMAPPLKAEATFFVLTSNPVNLCPFCDSDADWPTDIIVVLPEGEVEFRPNTDPVEIQGILNVGAYVEPTSGFYCRVWMTEAEVRVLR
jgi:hypothetical protein